MKKHNLNQITKQSAFTVPLLLGVALLTGCSQSQQPSSTNTQEEGPSIVNKATSVEESAQQKLAAQLLAATLKRSLDGDSTLSLQETKLREEFRANSQAQALKALHENSQFQIARSNSLIRAAKRKVEAQKRAEQQAVAMAPAQRSPVPDNSHTTVRRIYAVPGSNEYVVESPSQAPSPQPNTSGSAYFNQLAKEDQQRQADARMNQWQQEQAERNAYNQRRRNYEMDQKYNQVMPGRQRIVIPR